MDTERFKTAYRFASGSSVVDPKLILSSRKQEQPGKPAEIKYVTVEFFCGGPSKLKLQFVQPDGKSESIRRFILTFTEA